jgi:hypothetical protein
VDICWAEWGFRYTVSTRRMCEMSFEDHQLVIGPLWFEWSEWV